MVGLRARLADSRVAWLKPTAANPQSEERGCVRRTSRSAPDLRPGCDWPSAQSRSVAAASALLALLRVRVPSVAGLRLDMGEAGAGGRAGDADEVLARRTLNLPAGVAGVTLERLVAVGTVEPELGVAHSLHPFMHKTPAESMWRNVNTFCPLISHVEPDAPTTHAIPTGT
jgi:hypothetical protein